MAANVEVLVSEGVSAKARRRRLIIKIIVLAVVVHLLMGVGAGVWVVAKYLIPPPAVFEVKKDIRLAAKKKEHQMAMRDFDSMAPKPSFSDRLQSSKPTPFSLPALPKLPLDQAMPMEPDTIFSEVVGVGGIGTGQGYGSGRGGSKSNFNFDMKFFGIKDQGRNVIILIDTSDSMFSRVRRGQNHTFNFKNIKDETVKLIEGMNINAVFNIIVYEGGAMAFSDKSVAATDANKAAAKDWVLNLDENPSTSISGRQGRGPKLMKGGGTRLDTGFELAFQMNPDLIFLITDGEINRGGHEHKIPESEMVQIVNDLQKAQRKARNDDSEDAEAKIHVIQYMTTVARPDEVSTLRAIARVGHGRYRTLQAEEKKD